MVRSDQAIPACPSCHSWLPANAASFCPWCGAALSPPTLRCHVTTAVRRSGAATTVHSSGASCAEHLSSPPPPPPRVSPQPATPGITSVVVIGLSAALSVLFGLLRLWWAELVLVPATSLLIYSSVDVPWGQLGDRAERFALLRCGQLLAILRRGCVWTAGRSRRMRVWLAARGRHAQVWLEVRTQQMPVRRRHNQVLHALGQAVYSGDGERAAACRVAAATTGARLEHLERQLALVNEESARRLGQEQTATDATGVAAAVSRGERAEARRRR